MGTVTISIVTLKAMLGLLVAAVLTAAYHFARHRRLALEARRSARLMRRRREMFGNVLRAWRLVNELEEFGIWLFFPDDGRQVWSRGLRTIFGLATQEKLGEGDGDILLVSNGIDLAAMVSAREASSGPVGGRYQIRAIDGRERVVEMRACPISRPATSDHPVIAVFADVTRQSARERELQRSRLVAMEEARKAREEASRDPLTNLSNRRYVMAELDRLLMQSNRGYVSLSLVLFDVDHFKAVNDTHGHLAGDAVLRRIARITTEQAREGDVVGRIGGEEFVWLAVGADRPFARVIAERLRQAIAMRSAVGPVPPVTVSVGYVTAEPGDTSLSLFARADEALYEAKNSGRNTVRVAA